MTSWQAWWAAMMLFISGIGLGYVLRRKKYY
jgi:hypothetical protein